MTEIDTRTAGDDGVPETAEEVSTLALVSNAMVRIYKDTFGRGPTKVRSHFAGPDVLICVLRDTFTPAERNLLALGERQRLRDLRLFFQHASEDTFTEAVEEIVGRRVDSFLSGVDVDNDVAVEVFVLEPESGDGHSDRDAPAAVD